jgi:hypothetical protein
VSPDIQLYLSSTVPPNTARLHPAPIHTTVLPCAAHIDIDGPISSSPRRRPQSLRRVKRAQIIVFSFYQCRVNFRRGSTMPWTSLGSSRRPPRLPVSLRLPNISRSKARAMMRRTIRLTRKNRQLSFWNGNAFLSLFSRDCLTRLMTEKPSQGSPTLWTGSRSPDRPSPPDNDG